MFTPIASRYDRLNDVLSFGLQRCWKAHLVARSLALRPSASIWLDLATGTGDLAKRARNFRRSLSVLGVDPCRAMLEVARSRSSQVDWRLGAAEALPIPDSSVEILSCAFGVRNFAHRERAYEEWRRVLAPGGLVAILEIHPVPSGWRYLPLRFYWKRIMPRLGQALADGHAYRYLSDSSRSFLSVGELGAEVSSRGFRLLESHSHFAGGMVSSLFFERQ